MNYKEEWNKIGYNLEELYFEKVNRELIQKLKAQRLPTIIEKEVHMGKVIQFRAKPASVCNSAIKKAA